MDPKETINDILVNLFNEILKLEEEAIITEEFKDITKLLRKTFEDAILTTDIIVGFPGRSPLPSTAWSIKSM